MGVMSAEYSRQGEELSVIAKAIQVTVVINGGLVHENFSQVCMFNDSGIFGLGVGASDGFRYSMKDS